MRQTGWAQDLLLQVCIALCGYQRWGGGGLWHLPAGLLVGGGGERRWKVGEGGETGYWSLIWMD